MTKIFAKLYFSWTACLATTVQIYSINLNSNKNSSITASNKINL